jgi:hypothetical protein
VIRRPARWLAAPLLLGALLAGCGGSGTTAGQSTSAPSSSSSATSSTPPSGASSAAAAQAVETCKREIQAATTLPASSKSKLEAVCARAAEGSTTAVKKAVREVCEEAINKAPLPAAAKEPALAACRSKIK